MRKMFTHMVTLDTLSSNRLIKQQKADTGIPAQKGRGSFSSRPAWCCCIAS